MDKRITQQRLEELRSSTPHATANGVGITAQDDAHPELLEDLDAYFRHFAAPKTDDAGKPIEGHPCLVCDEMLNGGLIGLFGKGGFEWGIVHGRGHCRNCGWLATAYHFIKDRHGKELATLRNMILQDHPDDIEIRS